MAPFETRLGFDEIVDSAEQLGFDVVDTGGQPVSRTMFPSIEHDNLRNSMVRVTFREEFKDDDDDHIVVADLDVQDYVFHIVGSPRRLDDLRSSLQYTPPG
jgi:hypothetical protein